MFSIVSKEKKVTEKKLALISVVKYAMLSFTFIITFSIGTAWSYEDMYRFSNTQNVVPYPTPKLTTNNPFPAVTNMCKNFLKFAQYSTPTVTKSDSQRIVGKVAMLGIIFGARFALEPSNNDDLAKDKSNDYTQAVIKYRKCKKEQDLSKLVIIRQ